MKLSKFKFIVTTVIFVSFLLGASALFAQEFKDALLNNKITIDAEDGSVSHILSTMAKLSGCNIVLATETATEEKSQQVGEKKITIHLKEVPIEQALSLVVKSIGLSYRLIGEKTFLVGDKKRIEEEIGERSYVMNLNYVNVDKIAKALAILPGKSVPIEGQNALLIRANPETFSEISRKIEQIDVPQKQIEIRARLIEISVKEAEKYGIDWSKLEHLTTILAEDPVTAAGVGLPYNFDDETGAKPYGNMENDLGELPDQQYFQKINGLKDVGHFSRQLTAFDVTIDWLLEHNAAQLLTDTRVTALNGEEAEIHIGEVVPFVVTDKEYQLQVERENAGIILKVQPTVNKDGEITTKIEPEVSSVTELVGGYVPRTKVRKVISTVTVPNGKRIILGGLLNSTITKRTNKVPLLGDIPFLGKLFQHEEITVNNNDLIIEITPRVVDFHTEKAKEFDIDKRLDRRLIKEKEE